MAEEYKKVVAQRYHSSLLNHTSPPPRPKRLTSKDLKTATIALGIAIAGLTVAGTGAHAAVAAAPKEALAAREEVPGPSLQDIANDPDVKVIPKFSIPNSDTDANVKLNGYCKDCAGTADGKDGHRALVCLRSLLNTYEPDGKWQPIKRIYFNYDKSNNITTAFGGFDLPNAFYYHFSTNKGTGFGKFEFQCPHDGAAALACDTCTPFKGPHGVVLGVDDDVMPGH